MAEFYKINVLAHQLKNKVVAKHGEIVEDSQLTDTAKNLLAKGFIKKLDAKEVKAHKEAAKKAAAEAKAKVDAANKKQKLLGAVATAKADLTTAQNQKRLSGNALKQAEDAVKNGGLTVESCEKAVGEAKAAQTDAQTDAHTDAHKRDVEEYC